MCYKLGQEDLVLPDADVAFTSGIHLKLPYTCAVHLGRRVYYILKFAQPLKA